MPAHSDAARGQALTTTDLPGSDKSRHLALDNQNPRLCTLWPSGGARCLSLYTI